MRARAALFLRGALPSLALLLGSWKLSVVATVAAALYFAQLAVFAVRSPAEVVGNIAALAPFWAVYGLLLLNTGACLWLRLPLLLRDLRAEAAGPGARPRWAALGTYLFHGSFFVLAAGFVTTLAFREEFRLVAAVGEDFTGAPAQVLSRSGSPLVTRGLPEVRFTHEALEPAFWNDQLLFTQLEATLQLEGGARAKTAINRPLWLGFGTFLRLTGFGYAPRYELKARDGKVLETAFLKLNVFPPGQRDHFRSERFPHRFYVELYPDLAVEDGRPVTKSMNLVHPGFLVQVLRGRVDLGQKLLRGDQPIEFEALSLRFPEVRYWGEFAVLRDPGAPVLGLGFLMALAGLALKLRGRRAEVDGRADEGGGAARGGGGAPP